MSKFVTKKIAAIKGKQEFRQLVVVDNDTNVEKLQAQINLNEAEKKAISIDGVLDIYENSLEKKYSSSFIGLIAIMNRVANLELLPYTKFRDVTPTGDPVKEYEIKYQDLRVFAIKIDNGKLILLGGFKNNQDEDFRKFRSLKAQYFSAIQTKKSKP